MHGGAASRDSDATDAVTPIAQGPVPIIDLLDGAFAAMRHRPRVLLSVAAVVVLPFALIEGYLSRGVLGGAGLNDLLDDPTLLESGSAQGTEALVIYAIDWAQVALLGVPVSRVIGGWLRGVDVGARAALWFMVRRSWVIAVAFVLIHLAEALGSVLLVLPGVAAMFLFCLTSPVIAIEDHRGPIDAMRRSWSLVRRRFGSVIAVVVLTGIVSYGVSNAVELLPGLVSLFIGTNRAWPLISVSSMLSSLILVPFTSGAMCLLYLDIRFRTEGLDLEVRALEQSELEADHHAPREVHGRR